MLAGCVSLLYRKSKAVCQAALALVPSLLVVVQQPHVRNTRHCIVSEEHALDTTCRVHESRAHQNAGTQLHGEQACDWLLY
jgi:hypothetical protein